MLNGDSGAEPQVYRNSRGETVTSVAAGYDNAAFDMARRGDKIKAIYICPLKALCEERYNDWAAKLNPLGLRVEMVTGDTMSSDVNLDNIDLVVTTPEKWDSMTRRWNASKSLNGAMDTIGLLMVDEVHILGDDRGACLEGTVTR
jgi:ATP-dependent DNA helicase HFM1/MER3